jgi:tetratricopeptide (TPR) repeat protein
MLEMHDLKDDEEDKLSGNVLRGAELLRGDGGVRWPADHVELALVRMQRTRDRRRAVARTVQVGAIGALGLGALLVFGPSSTELRWPVQRRELTPVTAHAKATPGAPVAATPAAVATLPTPVAAPAGAPLAHESVAEAPSRPGHLLQQRVVPRRQVAAARWVALAGEKRFDEAYGLLQKVPMRELDDPDDLLLAADVVRQAGRPDQAVPFLERVVKDHPHELCAQLAGFSLGKVYLDSLNEPALAASSFARVLAAAPTGGLAQDALAREVEAWSRAGETARAHASALEYVRLYPQGRRLSAVRDLGGISP